MYSCLCSTMVLLPLLRMYVPWHEDTSDDKEFMFSDECVRVRVIVRVRVRVCLPWNQPTNGL